MATYNFVAYAPEEGSLLRLLPQEIREMPLSDEDLLSVTGRRYVRIAGTQIHSLYTAEGRDWDSLNGWRSEGAKVQEAVKTFIDFLLLHKDMDPQHVHNKWQELQQCQQSDHEELSSPPTETKAGVSPRQEHRDAVQ